MQIGTIIISEPYIQSDYDVSKKVLYIMESNIRRMKHMIDNGFYVSEYSEKAWQQFKALNV